MASTDPVPAEPDTGSPASAATPTIAAGAVSVVVGVLVLVWPDVSIVVLAWLFGVQLILAGVLQLVAAFWRNDGAAARVLLGLAGAFSILVGLLCLRGPLQTAVLLGLLVGATWVVTGIIGIVHAFGSGHGHGRGWGIASGFLTAIGGAIVLMYPGASIVVLTWLVGSCSSLPAWSSCSRDLRPSAPVVGTWPRRPVLGQDPPPPRRPNGDPAGRGRGRRTAPGEVRWHVIWSTRALATAMGRVLARVTPNPRSSGTDGSPSADGV